MFQRINASVDKKGDMVKSIGYKIKINTPGKVGQWAVTDMQIQEGSSAIEYVEHIAEMERVKERRIVYRTIEVEKGASIMMIDILSFTRGTLGVFYGLLLPEYFTDINTFEQTYPKV